LLTIEGLSSIESRKNRFENLGFDQSEAVPVRNLKTEFVQIEPFDEYEILHSYKNHYYIGYGSKNVKLSDFTSNLIILPKIEPVRTKWTVEILDKTAGHSFAGFSRFENLNFILSGFGFSEENSNHRKLSELMIIHENGDSEVLDTFEPLFSPICHVLGNHLILFGGRTSPNKSNSRVVIYDLTNWKNFECLDKIFDEKSENFAYYRCALVNIDESTFLRFGGRDQNGKFTNELTLNRLG
jgi:hypothetical protein